VKRSAPMKRTPIKRGTPPARREAKVYEVHTPKPASARDVRMSNAQDHAHVSVQKTPGRVDMAIRQSARDQECTLHLPGCPFDRAMTIWSHAPFGAAGKGMGLKSLDLCGAFACTHCDAIVDGQKPRPDGMSREQVLVEWLYGHLKSLVILRQKGLA
jgi:hypothetical protein